jgi:hypothetical protein
VTISICRSTGLLVNLNRLDEYPWPTGSSALPLQIAGSRTGECSNGPIPESHDLCWDAIVLI